MGAAKGQRTTLACAFVLIFVVTLVVGGCSARSDEVEAPTATPTRDPNRPPTLPPSPTPLLDFESAVLLSVAEAEAEAGTWPIIDGPVDPTAASGRYEGVADRVCVDVEPGVSETGAWRSGDFVAGSFDVYLEERPKDFIYSKLWWSPAYNRPDLLAGVTVRAVRLNSPAAESSMEVFSFDQVAWVLESHEATPTPLPEGVHPDYFYPSGLELPTGGHWMLVATMGPNWGCFVIELGGAVSSE